MTEIYQKWKKDPDILRLLRLFGAEGLTDDLQVLLEKAVLVDPCDNYRFRQRMAGPLGKKPTELRGPIRTLANAVAGKDWGTINTGVDPAAWEGDQHRKGLSHPQSLQDNTA